MLPEAPAHHDDLGSLLLGVLLRSREHVRHRQAHRVLIGVEARHVAQVDRLDEEVVGPRADHHRIPGSRVAHIARFAGEEAGSTSTVLQEPLLWQCVCVILSLVVVVVLLLLQV